MPIFKNLAAALNPNASLGLAPQSRSALVRQLLQSTGSPQGLVSAAGVANKALQGLLMRQASNAERKETEEQRKALARALGLPQETNIQMDDVQGGPSLTRTIQPAMTPEQKQLAALVGGLPQEGLQAAQMALLQKALGTEGEGFTLGQGQTRFGPDGKPIASVAPAPDEENNLPKLVNDISDDLYKESSDFALQLASMGRVRQSAEAPSAAGDMALIFNYMKMLDPSSVVREAEYATAENARGVPATIRNVWNRVLNGERLADEQRSDFVNRAERLFAQARADQGRRNDRFMTRATSLGVPQELFKPLLLPLDPSQAASVAAPAQPSVLPSVRPVVGPPTRRIP